MKQAWKNVRVQLVTTPWGPLVPLIILVGVTLLNIMIGAMIAGVEPYYSATANAPIWYFMVLGIFGVTATFPFSIALGSTRGAFTAGCFMIAAMGAIFLGILMTVGGFLEKATGGFGVNAYMYHLPWIWNHGWFWAFCFFAIVTFLVYSLGFFSAAIFKRFGMVVFVVGLLVLLGLALAAVWLAASTWGWVSIGTWISQLTVRGLSAGMLATSFVAALLSYSIIRGLSLR